tara:strand:+ start:410 stop:601 length:192 start_codon:yes stop_codon:yes gene_type:complete
VKTEYQKVAVPSTLARDCDLPPLPSEGANVVNDVLMQYMIGMELALKDCNTDKGAIRQWQSME